MGSRRANGEGSIYRTTDGRWRSSLTVGLKADGTPDRRYFSGRTQADVRAKLQKFREKSASGRIVRPSRETIETYIRRWLGEHVKAHKSPSTHAQYEAAAELIYPRIGSLILQQVTPSDMQRFADSLVLDEEASRLRQVAFGVLKRGLDHAVDVLEILASNPAKKIKAPAHEADEIFPFDKDQAAQLIEVSRGERGHVAVVLSLTMSLRIGEILGLPKDAIDLRKSTLKVSQHVVEANRLVAIRKPKTEESIRTIELTEAALQALDEHRVIMMKEGNAGHELLLLPARGGSLERRTNFARRDWKKIQKAAGIGDLRGFHHCRHTYATLALTAGVPCHIVSKVMGHKKPSTTWDIYSHLLPGQQAQSTNAMNHLFQARKSG